MRIECKHMAFGESFGALFAYPRRRHTEDSGTLKEKLKTVFQLWNQLRIANAVIASKQVYARPGYHTVVLPNEDTVYYEKYGGDEGVLFQRDSRRFKIVDEAKVLKSGRYMYAVCYAQVLHLLGITAFDKENIEAF